MQQGWIIQKLYNLFFFITDHVDKLLDLIFDRVFQDLVTYVDEVLKIPIPEDLSAQFEKPDKLEVIAGYVSRFNQGQV